MLNRFLYMFDVCCAVHLDVIWCDIVHNETTEALHHCVNRHRYNNLINDGGAPNMRGVLVEADSSIEPRIKVGRNPASRIAPSLQMQKRTGIGAI